MATDIEQITVDGQGLQQPDLNTPFREAALADDVVLAELLHLPPFDGVNVAKAIVPFRAHGTGTPLVSPNGASGSVYIQPFRIIVGSRTAVSATPGTPLLNLNDIRSRVYAVSGDNINLGISQAFASNSSGNPRWDIVYASIQVDQNAPNVTRNVRSPGTSLTVPPVPTSVVPALTQTVTIGVATGATSPTPTLPTLPADTVTATGTYYVPLAAVLIPNGFNGATTTVLSKWIYMLAPIVPISSVMGGVDCRPPDKLSTGLALSAVEAWGSSGTRPTQALPCTMQGEIRRQFGFDGTTVSPLIGNGAVLDSSIDWRKRRFTVRCSGKAGATQFAWQPGATSGAIPQAGGGMVSVTQESQSFVDDATAVFGVGSGASGVFYVNNAAFSLIAAGPNSFGLYVDLTSGNLLVYYQGTIGCLLTLTVTATAPFDNV